MYDYAVGGVPFLSATSDTRPDTEKPVQQRKQQFDNYKDPGEYSLNQWWLRSQSSFQGGAGVTYQDPDTQGTALNTRYNKSVGIDPFTDPDIIQLLREVNKSSVYTSADGAGLGVISFDNGSSSKLWMVDNRGNVTNATVGASDISVIATTTVPANVLVSHLDIYNTSGNPAVNFTDNNQLLVYSNTAGTGGVFKIDDGGMTVTRIYARYVFPTALPVNAMKLTRGRIYINLGCQLFALDPAAAANTPWPATPAASVPVNHEIVSIADGPDAIYVASNDGHRGYIFKTTFDNNGIVNGLTQVAILPDGEQINYIAAYLATYMVITTQTGIRVANFTGSGLTYGPPIITVPIETTHPIPGVGFRGSGFGKVQFFGDLAFITTQSTESNLHDGAAGIIAINLSVINADNNTNSQVNAYSSWVYNSTTTNYITDITVTGDGRIIYGSSTSVSSLFPNSLWIEHATNRISQGYLDTGRCRFNTIEPKLFKYFSIRTPTPLLGDIQVAVIDDQGAITTYITYGPTVDPGTGDIATPAPPGPRNYESLRFTLKRNPSNLSVGGVLDSWQIKALPGVLKQRIITRQFLCMNSEKDKSGQRIAGDTQALDKLTAIRQMCQRGDTVTLQDLVNNISDQVIIDDYQFTMLTTPGPNKENYGGYLTVVMRTVADAVPPISVSGSGVDEA